MTRTTLKKLEHKAIPRPEAGNWPSPVITENLETKVDQILNSGSSDVRNRLTEVLGKLGLTELLEKKKGGNREIM